MEEALKTLMIECLTAENLDKQAKIESLKESLGEKDEHLGRLDQHLNTLTARVNAMEK